MKFNLVLISLLLTVSLSAAGDRKQSGDAQTVTEQPEVLIVARPGDASSLDSGRETDGETFYVTKQIFENLTRFKEDSLEIEPSLASSWEVSADQLSYTFKLRQGVKFHDGSDFNADAVLFSFDRQRLEEHPFYDQGPWPYWQAMGMSSLVNTIEKIDDYTVSITLTRPDAPFLANLAMEFAAIVSPTAIEKWGIDFGEHPVGTGAYRFVSWQRGDRIILESFDDYWGEPPAIQRVIVRVIQDQSARWLALQNGEVDMIDLPSPNDLDAIKADARFKVLSEPGLNVAYLAFNTQKPPFDSVQVRQAVSYAINREELVKAVFPGDAGVVAKAPIPPTMWSYNDHLNVYNYDPQKARDLLSEAGFPDGFETTLWAIPVTRPYMPNGRRAAEIMQSQLREIGIKAEIVSYDWSTYLDKVSRAEHDMAMLGWNGDNGDPDNFLRTLLSKQAAIQPASNIAFWENDEYDDLVNQAVQISDREMRTELYLKAQEIFIEQAPWVLLAHGIINTPMVNDLQGLRYQPSSNYDFRNGYFSQQ